MFCTLKNEKYSEKYVNKMYTERKIWRKYWYIRIYWYFYVRRHFVSTHLQKIYTWFIQKKLTRHTQIKNHSIQTVMVMLSLPF